MSSFVKKTSKSFKDVGTTIAERRSSFTGRNDSSSGRGVDEREYDGVPAVSTDDLVGLAAAAERREREEQEMLDATAMPPPPPMTPSSTRSEGGRFSKRKLLKKKLSMTKHVSGKHRNSQSLPQDMGANLSQLAMAANSDSQPTLVAPPSIINTASRSRSTGSMLAGAKQDVDTNSNTTTNTSIKDGPRAIVIEPLPQSSEKTGRSRSNSGIGVGGLSHKRIGSELLRSLRKVKNENTEAAAAVGLDKDIGLKLALPDKLDIMCGKATPPLPGTADATTSSDADRRDDHECDDYANPFAYNTPTNSPRKKLIMLPQDAKLRDTPLSAIRKKLSIPNLHATSIPTPPGLGGTDSRSVQSTGSHTSGGSRHSRANSRDGNSSIAKPTDDRPVRATCDPVKDEIVLRTSELEPSVHQVALPKATDLLLCARVCSLLEGYDRLLRHQASKGRRWFDFSELVGAERFELEEAYLRALGHHKEADEKAKKAAVSNSISAMGASTQPPRSGNPFGGPAPKVSLEVGPMEEVSLLGDIDAETVPVRFSDPKNLPHPSILKSLLDCGDDIKVEGYFTETIGEDDEGLSIPALEHGERTIFPEDHTENAGSVTVAVFSSQQHRQFIVCYRGTAEQQAKPVKSHTRQRDANGEPSVLHPTHAVLVNPEFRDCYFTNNLERKLFSLLDDLTSANPFCDVVYCGHSFGGALSTIGATRYAALFPMMTVHCHTFGVPKVGGKTFRHFANSLPNLKVMRIENGADYYPHFPLGEKWDHAGHTIVISPPQTDISTLTKDKLAKVKSGTNPIGAGSFVGKNRISVLAYKFDKRAVGDHQPSIMPYVPSNIHNPSSKALDPLSRTKKERGKNDHEMNSYLLGIERFTHLGQPWVTDYVGEEGGGIVRGGGSDYEERYLV